MKLNSGINLNQTYLQRSDETSLAWKQSHHQIHLSLGELSKKNLHFIIDLHQKIIVSCKMSFNTMHCIKNTFHNTLQKKLAWINIFKYSNQKKCQCEKKIDKLYLISNICLLSFYWPNLKCIDSFAQEVYSSNLFPRIEEPFGTKQKKFKTLIS